MIFPVFLRILSVPLLATVAFAQRGPKGSAPLNAELHIVKSMPFAQKLATVGTLRANETVTLA